MSEAVPLFLPRPSHFHYSFAYLSEVSVEAAHEPLHECFEPGGCQLVGVRDGRAPHGRKRDAVSRLTQQHQPEKRMIIRRDACNAMCVQRTKCVSSLFLLH